MPIVSLEDPWAVGMIICILSTYLRRRRLNDGGKAFALENDSRGFDTRMELYRLIRNITNLLEIP